MTPSSLGDRAAPQHPSGVEDEPAQVSGEVRRVVRTDRRSAEDGPMLYFDVREDVLEASAEERAQSTPEKGDEN